ncbi:hypothetical protein Y1Q_0017934 [Alligator mississippiensis]|uniref:Uncharacterized protein n=1 Tax=Alligator mississippiensis TaxID=8496 RepID=A0A151MXV3_ALLMI|nr:hypothetical protein Y1Q_0017934 [Alligator mississippiensis]
MTSMESRTPSLLVQGGPELGIEACIKRETVIKLTGCRSCKEYISEGNPSIHKFGPSEFALLHGILE